MTPSTKPNGAQPLPQSEPLTFSAIQLSPQAVQVTDTAFSRMPVSGSR